MLGAADLVAIPYDDIMHSGSALLALSFDRPVLVPEAGAMEELQEDVGPDWVYTYNGPLTASTLESTLQAAQSASRVARAPIDHRSWDPLARQTMALYERVLSA